MFDCTSKFKALRRYIISTYIREVSLNGVSHLTAKESQQQLL